MKIRLLSKGKTVAEIEVDDVPWTVGRDQACNVTLNDGSVATCHARLSVVNDQLTVEDLGSPLGTMVNGQQITEPTVLADGASLTLGNVGFTIAIAPAASSDTTQEPIGQTATDPVPHVESKASKLAKDLNRAISAGANEVKRGMTLAWVKAQLEKLKRVDLPRAFAELGAQAFHLGIANDAFNEIYAEIRRLDQMIELKRKGVTARADASFVDKSTAVALSAKMKVEAELLSRKRAAQTRKLGRSLFEANRHDVDLATQFAALTAILQHIARLEAEYAGNVQDRSNREALLTATGRNASRLIIPALALVAVAGLLAIVLLRASSTRAQRNPGSAGHINVATHMPSPIDYIKGGNRLAALNEIFNSPVPHTGGIYDAPFGFELTPGLPNGFKGAEWGDDLAAVRATTDAAGLVRSFTNHVVLTVKEQIRTLEYYIDNSMGLIRVVVQYEPTKTTEVTDALVKQFGKVPQSNIHTRDESVGSRGTLQATEINWMSEKTHVCLAWRFTITGIARYGPSENLTLVFEDRRQLNALWRHQLQLFMRDNVPQLGQIPYSPQLTWGMQLDQVARAETKKGNPVLPGARTMEFSRGIRGLFNTPMAFSSAQAVHNLLIFDPTDGLVACCRGLAPQNEQTASLALRQLAILLGHGSVYRHSRVPPGVEVLSAIQWNPSPDAVVRCTIMRTPKHTVMTEIEYGRRDFLSDFARLAEVASSNEKGYQF
jgi:hypothetical protein